MDTSKVKQSRVENLTTDLADINTRIANAGKGWEPNPSWLDIRSGAQSNSIYLLAGHKPGQTGQGSFDNLAFFCDCTSGYKVSIDGVWLSTTFATGTTCTIKWSTQGVTTGMDVSYPMALRTHVIRITPVVSTERLTRFQCKKVDAAITEGEQQGILWAHFNIDNPIDIQRAFYDFRGITASILYAITSQNNVLTVLSAQEVCSNAWNLESIPTLVQTGTNTRCFQGVVAGVSRVKAVTFENGNATDGDYSFTFFGNFGLDEVILRNCNTANVSEWTFCHRNNFALKRLPEYDFTGAIFMENFATMCTSLAPTILDVSLATRLKILHFFGDANNPCWGLKGVILNSSAPLDYTAGPQLAFQYTGLDRAALVALFNSMPTVTAGQVCALTGAVGAADLTAADIAIATGKGWTITR